MAEVTRRGFLALFGAAAAVSVTGLPVATEAAVNSSLPRIVGDGIHDDTAGLQAFIDRKPVLVDEAIAIIYPDGTAHIRNARFKITSTLNVKACKQTFIDSCHFINSGGGGVIFDFSR